MTQVSYDGSVLVDTGNGFHVSWPLLTTAIQNDLIANFGGALSDDLLAILPDQGTAQNPQIEKWLDQAYIVRTSLAQGLNPIDTP